MYLIIRVFLYDSLCICLLECFMYLIIRVLIGVYFFLIDRSYWWLMWRFFGFVCRRIEVVLLGVFLKLLLGLFFLKEEGIV